MKKIANVSNGLQVIIAVKLKEDVWIVNLVIMEQIAKIDVIQRVKQIYVVRLNISSFLPSKICFGPKCFGILSIILSPFVFALKNDSVDN